jgi:hypothetical protein
MDKGGEGKKKRKEKKRKEKKGKKEKNLTSGPYSG